MFALILLLVIQAAMSVVEFIEWLVLLPGWAVAAVSQWPLRITGAIKIGLRRSSSAVRHMYFTSHLHLLSTGCCIVLTYVRSRGWALRRARAGGLAWHWQRGLLSTLHRGAPAPPSQGPQAHHSRNPIHCGCSETIQGSGCNSRLRVRQPAAAASRQGSEPVHPIATVRSSCANQPAREHFQSLTRTHVCVCVLLCNSYTAALKEFLKRWAALDWTTFLMPLRAAGHAVSEQAPPVDAILAAVDKRIQENVHKGVFSLFVMEQPDHEFAETSHSYEGEYVDFIMYINAKVSWKLAAQRKRSLFLL